jgi:pilus assembly protein CpaB
MRIVTIALVVVAVVAAGAIAYLLNGMVAQKAEAPKAPETVVLIASKSLPAGSLIDEGDVKWQAWPEGSVPDSFISSTTGGGTVPENVLGAVVRRAVTEGEPIVSGKLFKRDQPGYLAGSLSAGMRAATINVKADSGISGFVFPGDSVDVILTHDTLRDVFSQERKKSIEDAGASPPFIVKYISESILKNVRVLAIDQKVNDFESKAVPVKQVTLEVDPKQAEILATAKSMGKLSLVLRSLEEGGAIEDDLAFTTDVDVSPLLRNLGNLDQILINREQGGGALRRAAKNAKNAKNEGRGTASTAKGGETKILVAMTDLPVGAALNSSKAQWISWPAGSVSTQYIVQKDGQSVTDAIRDMVVKRQISIGDPINVSKIFKRGEAGFLSGTLKAGMRAATIGVTPASAASGFILPGDYVDIILTHDAANTIFCQSCVAGEVIARKLLAKDAPLVMVRYISENILSNVRVLALDQKLDDFDATAIMARRVTLEVTRKQAEKLASATAMGELSLALRSLAPSEAETEPFAFTSDVEVSPLLSNIDQVLNERRKVIQGRKQASSAAPASVTAAPSRERRSSQRTMKVYRGADATTQTFGSK